MKSRLLFIPFILVFSFYINTGAIAQELFCEPLDDFLNSENNPTVLDQENPGPVNFVDEDSGILGNFREVNYGPYNANGAFDQAQLSIEIGQVSLSNGDTSAPLELLYDANGAGLDLDLSTRDLLTFTLLFNDLVGTSFNMVIRDSNSIEANSLIPNLPSQNGGDSLPTEIDLQIANFSGVENVDLSNIQAIEIFINPSDSADTSFSVVEICGPPVRNIPTLSEWSMIVMAGVLGLVGFMVVRRRKLAA